MAELAKRSHCLLIAWESLDGACEVWWGPDDETASYALGLGTFACRSLYEHMAGGDVA